MAPPTDEHDESADQGSLSGRDYLASADEWFATSVRQYREGEGWSMNELATRLQAEGLTNVYPTTIKRIESGERPVRLSEAAAIARVFRSDLGDLIAPPFVGDEKLQLLTAAYIGLIDRAAETLVGLEERETELRAEIAAVRGLLDTGKFDVKNDPENRSSVELHLVEAENALSYDLEQARAELSPPDDSET